MFSLESNAGAVVFISGKTRLRIWLVTESIARVTVTEGKEFQTKPSLIVTSAAKFSGYKINEAATNFEIVTPALKLVVNKATGAIQYFDSTGKLLLREPESGGKNLSLKKVFRNVFKSGAQVAASQSIDGARAAATERRSGARCAIRGAAWRGPRRTQS